MLKLTGFTFLLLIWMANCDNFSLSGKIKEVSSVAQNIGQLPCSIESLDDVAMILWFKGSSGAPIYSYDARNEEEEPRHLTLKNDWGLRLYFRIWPNLRRSPALFIRDVQLNDEGVYRCRVDYRSSPTTNSVIRLKVIEPPTHLEIRDTTPSRPISDQQMVPAAPGEHSDITYMGPYYEGQNLTIACSAFGGRPPAKVTWYRNGKIINTRDYLANGGVIETSYKVIGDNYATNELRLFKLKSQHSTDLYTCQALNNNESKPISHSVNLDVYLGVKTVEIEVPDEMTAGNNYSINCKASGAYPSVKMEFWKMQKRVGSTYQTRSDVDNVTIYTILYQPETNDDELTISCKAENPWLNEQEAGVIARKTLKIKYTPIVILRFGQNKTSDFTEGESVLMECHVKSNPPIYSIMWFHKNDQLYNNETAGIRINGMTLLLTNLKPNYGGKYFCQAVNEVGKGKSNPLIIPLHISPKCTNSEALQIPLDIGESHQLLCNILAWPGDLNFYWTLNESHDIVPILNVSVGNGNPKDVPFLEEIEDYLYPIWNIDYEHLHLPMEGSREVENIPNPPRSPSSISSTLSHEDNNLSGNGTQSVNGIVGQENRGWHNSSTLKTKSTKKSQAQMSSSLNSEAGGKEDPQLKSKDKRNQQIGSKSSDGSKTKSKSGGESRSSQYGRLKTPQDNPDNIHHQAILSYTIRTIEDYGMVACWAENSYGKQQPLPCLFHIISKHEANRDEAMGSATRSTNRRYEGTNLTEGNSLDIKASSITKSTKTTTSHGEEGKESGIRVPSKLQTTLGIILIVLLIFITSLGGILLFLLVVVAKRRRQIQRMVMTNNKKKGEEESTQSNMKKKCTSSISFSSFSPDDFNKGSGIDGGSGGGRGTFSFTSESSSGYGDEGGCRFNENEPSTTFTSLRRIISNQNNFPPPPTSIISTATSTSHGYGSIEEDEEESQSQLL